MSRTRYKKLQMPEGYVPGQAFERAWKRVLKRHKAEQRKAAHSAIVQGGPPFNFLKRRRAK